MASMLASQAAKPENFDGNDIAILHMLVVLAVAGLAIGWIMAIPIYIKLFWIAYDFLRYLIWDVIWNAGLKRFGIFFYNDVIIPVWNWIKMAWWAVYNFTKDAIVWIINFAKKVFHIGKQVGGKAVDIAVAGAGIAKDVGLKIFEIGEGIVIEGINIVIAIWNFLKDFFSPIIDVLVSIFSSAIDFFGDLATSITDVISSVLNVF